MLVILFKSNFSSETEGCQDWNPNVDTEPTLNIFYEEEDLKL